MKTSLLQHVSIKNIDALPAACGVYFFLNIKKEILYIGKSTNIRKRIQDHMRGKSMHASGSHWVGWIETETEIEALLKEADLVKHYLPKGNILLKDDKKYFYIVVLRQKSTEKKKRGFPYVLLTHQPHAFVKERGVLHVIGPFTEGRAVKKILRYLRKIFPFYTTQRHGTQQCSYCHLGLCPGPTPDEKTYKTNIKILIKILQGKYRAVERDLAKQMDEASRALAFEKAQQAKETLQALEQVFAHKDFLISKEEFRHQGFGEQAGKFLQKILGTTYEISSIEGYDISNIQGHEPTASMVRFESGKPNKNLYRKFHIRLPETPNDFAMMNEVISRRLSHPEWPYPDLILIDGGKGQLNAARSAMHNFSLAHPAERENMPCIASIAKRYNELFLSSRKNSLKLDTDVDSSVRNLLMYVRDESHRFAIAYHRKLHRKTFTK